MVNAVVTAMTEIEDGKGKITLAELKSAPTDGRLILYLSPLRRKALEVLCATHRPKCNLSALLDTIIDEHPLGEKIRALETEIEVQAIKWVEEQVKDQEDRCSSNLSGGHGKGKGKGKVTVSQALDSVGLTQYDGNHWTLTPMAGTEATVRGLEWFQYQQPSTESIFDEVNPDPDSDELPGIIPPELKVKQRKIGG